MRRLDILLFVACVIGAGSWVWKKHLWPRPNSRSEAINLATDPRVSALYNLSPEDQHLLVQTVEHFCVKRYLRDTCIHHLITCGSPCLVVIPKAQRAKIFADYQALRMARGLPAVSRTPSSDKEPF